MRKYLTFNLIYSHVNLVNHVKYVYAYFMVHVLFHVDIFGSIKTSEKVTLMF